MSAPHILLIDDEAIALTNLTHVLQREGYRVTACRDGETGLAALKQGDVDLVLLGRGTVDSDTSQVGPSLAQRLGYTSLMYVSKLIEVDPNAKTISVERLLEQGRQLTSSSLPAGPHEARIRSGVAPRCTPRRRALRQRASHRLRATTTRRRVLPAQIRTSLRNVPPSASLRASSIPSIPVRRMSAA